MYTLSDLEIQIEYEAKKKQASPIIKFLKEARLFLSIFAVTFVGMYLVTNAQLVSDKIEDQINPHQVQTFSEQESQINVKPSIAQNAKAYQEKQQQLNQLITTYGEVTTIEKEIVPDTDQILTKQLNSYPLTFNLLPPINRIIIPSIGVDTPIVQRQAKSHDAFVNGDFSDELENGVVKYPTSPAPGEKGNLFLFGHTSQEYRKHNKYGTVFRNIPKLKPGDEIQIVREGNLYTYKVVTTEIVSPKKVGDTYLKYANLDKEYLTLM
ncbi:class E sortase [bacterium]|nr:class E sortase [bacterium]